MSKSHEILSTLSSPGGVVNLWKLRELGLTSGGFLNSELRVSAWAKLLHTSKFDVDHDDCNPPYTNSEAVISQVQRDVERSLWHFDDYTPPEFDPQSPNSKNKKAHQKYTKKIKAKQKILSVVILEVLRKGKGTTHYFQGFHDIASIFISTISDASLTTKILFKLSQNNFKDSMSSDFTNISLALRTTIFPLISHFDPELHAFIKESSVEPFFALSWIITWFSHDIRDVKTAARMFDVFLCSHALFPIYVAVAMICHEKVSERSERALRKTRILASNLTKWLQTATSTAITN